MSATLLVSFAVVLGSAIALFLRARFLLVALFLQGLFFYHVLAPAWIEYGGSEIRIPIGQTTRDAQLSLYGADVLLLVGFLIGAVAFGYRRMAISPDRKLPPWLKRSALICSVLGLTAMAARFVLRGGVQSVWLRESDVVVPFAGLLDALVMLSLTFPLITLHSVLTGTPSAPGRNEKVLSLGILGSFLGMSLVSGITTQAVVIGAPLAFLLVWKGRMLTLSGRFVAVLLVALLAIATFRFARAVGSSTAGGREETTMENILTAYEDVALEVSFGEYHVFNDVFGYTSYAGPVLHGKSYRAALLYFIPGILDPLKAQKIDEGKSDAWIASRIYDRRNLIPGGYPSEALLNGGIPLLMGISFLIGFLLAALEAVGSHTGSGVPGWIPALMLTAHLILSIRGDLLSSFMVGVVSVLILWGVGWGVRAWTAGSCSHPSRVGIP